MQRVLGFLTHSGRRHSLCDAVICFIVIAYFYLCFLNCSCPGCKYKTCFGKGGGWSEMSGHFWAGNDLEVTACGRHRCWVRPQGRSGGRSRAVVGTRAAATSCRFPWVFWGWPGGVWRLWAGASSAPMPHGVNTEQGAGACPLTAWADAEVCSGGDSSPTTAKDAIT